MNPGNGATGGSANGIAVFFVPGSATVHANTFTTLTGGDGGRGVRGGYGGNATGVVFFGNNDGSFNGTQASFNLPGPDLSAADYGRLLDTLGTRRVVFVNTTSSSGGFLPVVSGPGRAIVSGTKTGGLQTSALAAGLSTAAIVFLEQESQKRADLSGAAESLLLRDTLLYWIVVVPIGAASKVRLGHTLLKFAWLRNAQGAHQDAVRLLGALSRIDYRMARGLSREVGALVVDEQDIIGATRAALGESEFAAAWAEGESLTLERVSAEILADVSPFSTP